MVVCAQCGEHNADGARFCSSCNAFLEWEGAREDRPVATVASTAEATPGSVAQPSEQVVQPPRHTATSTGTPQRRPPAPGDLICGKCGEGNAPNRQFCRRCAASLVEAGEVRPPWWRRWLPKRTRAHVASRLGHAERRGRHNRFGRGVRRTLRWGRNIIAVLVVLGGIVYGIYPPFRHTVNADVVAIKNGTIGKLETKPTPVHADKVVATAADPGHPADLVNDNIIGTYWEAPTNGVEPALVLSFDHKANLAQAIIRSGIGNDFQAA
ncbi:MAG TPA: zinc ribbon domain-containing protein, partial [Pseudonocardiaceae bacterium]|nr:zinc ribbon domain-containing protein [Pseudonocardiaceae bacterium]